MLSPVLNTIAAFAFTTFVVCWIGAVVVDRSCGEGGIGRRTLAIILLVAGLAGGWAAVQSWHTGELRHDQTLEADYELRR